MSSRLPSKPNGRRFWRKWAKKRRYKDECSRRVHQGRLARGKRATKFPSAGLFRANWLWQRRHHPKSRTTCAVRLGESCDCGCRAFWSWPKRKTDEGILDRISDDADFAERKTKAGELPRLNPDATWWATRGSLDIRTDVQRKILPIVLPKVVKR